MPEQQAERTEPATPKRRRDFREKGQVARSREIGSIVMLVGLLVYFYFAGQTVFEKVSLFMRKNFELSPHFDINSHMVPTLIAINLEIFILLLAPVLALSLVLTLLSNFAQTGWMFTTHPLIPDPNRINPATRFKELFLNPRILIDSALNILKVSLLTGILYVIISGKIDDLPGLIYLTPYSIARFIMMSILEIMLITALLFIIVAIADYIHQWHQLEKQMKMTKQELKDEFKEQEGDPMQKSQMRSRMRDISMNKMIETVPKASVVVTNPTRLAVALKYEHGDDEAPKVVAKGRGFWAERIKTIARENGVRIVEDRILARALYKTVRVGAEIPYNLYRAVAEILAQIFALDQKMSRV